LIIFTVWVIAQAVILDVVLHFRFALEVWADYIARDCLADYIAATFAKVQE